MLQVLALWTLAVAQPVYKTLGGEIEFFIAHDCQPLDLALFVLGLSLLVPLLLALACAALRPLSSRAYAGAHIGLCAALAGVFGLQAAKAVGAPAGLDLLLAVAAALLTARGMARSAGFRRFLVVLSFSVLVCPVLFFNTGRISQLAMGVLNTDPVLPPVKATTPVVFIVFDEFPQYAILDRKGNVDASRFPNLATLAGQSTWYRYASATCDDTTVSVPAILTGTFPDPRRTPLISDHPKNLFTLLGATYQMKAEEFVTRLAPRGSGQTMSDSLRDRLLLLAEDTGIYFLHIALPTRMGSAWLPSVEFSWSGFARPGNAREARAADFERFVSKIQPSERPVLYYKLVTLPHYPYVYLPSGQEYDNSGAPVCDGLDDQVWRGEWEAQVALQRELLQSAFVDKLVGDLVARLKTVGLYDRCLLVITSDHGASFRGGVPHRQSTEDNLAEQLFVPLFIKEPGQKRGKVSLSNATSLDILPTVADILGISVPWETGGRSLRWAPDRPEGEKVFLGTLHAEKPTLFRAAAWEEAYQKTRTLAANLFPEPGLEGLYRIGPRHQELYGKSLETLAIGDPAAHEYELPFSGLLENVDPKAPFLPVRLKGDIAGAYQTEEPTPLAVAMHGKIAALSYLMRDGSFDTLLDPALLRPGDNSVQLFVIDGATLRPLLEKRRSYRVESDGVAEEEGESYPFLQTDSLLTSWVLEGNRVVLKGYAVPPAGETATRLMVFQGDRYVCDWQLKPNEALRFERDVPRELLGDQLPRLFVLFSGGGSVELAQRDNYALRTAVITSSGGQAAQEH